MPNRTTESLDDGRITFTESGVAEVTDLVCGMDMDPTAQNTLRSKYGGKTYYFCSTACNAAFASDPREFVTSSDLSV